MAVTLGKDVTVTGMEHVREITLTSSANEVECTTFDDGKAGFRKYKKTLIEQTVEAECVDDPGTKIGEIFTLGHTGLALCDTIKFVVTTITKSDPIDGILTYSVSGSRTDQAGS